MKNLKTFSLLLFTILLLGLFTGCSTKAPQDTPDASDAAVTAVDMTGRTISLTEPATRVVALSAADCEILYALGAGDTLVGRGEYCDYPAEVMEIPSVQSGAETNLEQIIALNPQVLLMSAMAQTKEQVEKLENAGIRVVVSDADNIQEAYSSIELIGTILGKDNEAAQIIDNMKSTFDTIAKDATLDGSKTVYFEVSPLEFGLWAAGKTSYMHEIAEMLGLRNIFEDIEDDWAEVSEEQVLSRNPDYIVTVAMFFGDGPTPEEEILSRPGWETVTAVKNGAILNLRNNELSRPAPRLAEGAQLMFDFIYGDQK